MEQLTPSCPECGGDMMGYRAEATGDTLIWACRACGSTFTVSDQGKLQPYQLEIYYPACPGCGNSMVAAGTAGRATTKWICKHCGEEIYM